MVPPNTENTRPVMSFEAVLPNHTTVGEMFSGASGSAAPAESLIAWTEARSSVNRVSAVGEIALTVIP